MACAVDARTDCSLCRSDNGIGLGIHDTGWGLAARSDDVHCRMGPIHLVPYRESVLGEDGAYPDRSRTSRD